MNLVKTKSLEISVYWATPPVLAAWRQRSAYYKRGFVVRLAWLGFVLRFQEQDRFVREQLLAKREQRKRTIALWNLFSHCVETDGYDPEPEDYDALIDNLTGQHDSH